MDLEIRQLDHTRDEDAPPRSRSGWLLLVLVILLAGGAGWYFFLRQPRETQVQVQTETAQPVQPADSAPAAVPGDDIPLPPLDESDALVRELVARLSAHPRVAAWLTTDHLIRNFTAVVLNIAQGQSPAVHLRGIAPQGSFQVQPSGSQFVVDTASYRRYDTYADAVDGLDPQGTARLYATLKPRIDDAYRDLGAPDEDFSRTLERAIVALLETPVPTGPVRLEGDSVAYTYADTRLESLSAAQRQFLRMGPRNMRLVKSKLREIARHLGIPDSSLPPADDLN
jgi:hypothetical protein